MRKLIAGILLIVFVESVSGATTVPNTFIAGTPAKAAAVNANFKALVTAINTLNTKVTSLTNSVNSLNAKVSKLQGNITAADLAGTYSVIEIDFVQTSTNNGTNSPSLTSGIQSSFMTNYEESVGTFTLNKDLSYSLSLTGVQSQIHFSVTGDLQDANQFTGGSLTGNSESFPCCLGNAIQQNVVVLGQSQLDLVSDPRSDSGTWSYSSGVLNTSGGGQLGVALGGRTLIGFSNDGSGAHEFIAFKIN